MEELDVKIEDEIEWEKVSKLCDFLISLFEVPLAKI
jgi:hypothetical protein